ncbi:MAG: glycosyltransferase [Candidatus Eremiobacteraeota bacterium]|nr:glycosyltransferase [Candidatus Eremiobacteraeota bacterium]MCW5869101.1 glycosyltransferase [Candidatus Eremiobacteraeota bacterium]
MDLSIVIPAYNEEHKISRDLEAALAFLDAYSLRGEILVVDDGSKDNTIQRVQEFPQVTLLEYGRNRGKGYATRYGIARTQGNCVMFADAGLCVPYELALVGMTYIRHNMCDIAVGNRRISGSRLEGQRFYRRVGTWLNSLMVRGLMGIPWYLNDTQCGFKMFRGTVARQIYGEMITDRMMADIEMLLRSHRAGHRIMNFAVPWTADLDTRFNPLWGQLNNFAELAKIKRMLWKAGK